METTKIKLDEEIIKVCFKIAKKGEGGLIVVGENLIYSPLIEQIIPSFKVVNNLKLLEQLAKIDGAVVINHKGYMVSYGVKLKSDKVFKGFGTRHSAALSVASNKDTTAYLISEEENKIKIFKNGKIIMQIDPLEKGVDKRISEGIDIIRSIGIGTVGSIGVAALVPTLGISLIPGILFFGSSHFILNLLNNKKNGKVK